MNEETQARSLIQIMLYLLSNTTYANLKIPFYNYKENQNMVHWRRDWQTTPVFLPWEPHEQYENRKNDDNPMLARYGSGFDTK